jgi:hypothetical protein
MTPPCVMYNKLLRWNANLFSFLLSIFFFFNPSIYFVLFFYLLLSIIDFRQSLFLYYFHFLLIFHKDLVSLVFTKILLTIFFQKNIVHFFSISLHDQTLKIYLVMKCYNLFYYINVNKYTIIGNHLLYLLILWHQLLMFCVECTILCAHEVFLIVNNILLIICE